MRFASGSAVGYVDTMMEITATSPALKSEWYMRSKTSAGDRSAAPSAANARAFALENIPDIICKRSEALAAPSEPCTLSVEKSRAGARKAAPLVALRR